MPSLMEDIQRARDDAAHFRRLLADNTLLDGPIQRLAEQARQQIPRYLKLLDNTIAHFDRILEVATDPSMSLADEIVRLKSEILHAKEVAEERIVAHQGEAAALKNAAIVSKRNFREELERRDDARKQFVAEMTKQHVQELERLKVAHQLEENVWRKKLQECRPQLADNQSAGEETRPRDIVSEFANAVTLFDPKEEDIR